MGSGTKTKNKDKVAANGAENGKPAKGVRLDSILQSNTVQLDFSKDEGLEELQVEVLSLRTVKWGKAKQLVSLSSDESDEATAKAIVASEDIVKELVVSWNITDSNDKPFPVPKQSGNPDKIIDQIPIGLVELISTKIMDTMRPPDGRQTSRR